jgi:hypothetical protein
MDEEIDRQAKPVFQFHLDSPLSDSGYSPIGFNQDVYIPSSGLLIQPGTI